jgi:hypothetical protein
MMVFVQGYDQNMENGENARTGQELPQDHAQWGAIQADEEEIDIAKLDIYHE